MAIHKRLTCIGYLIQDAKKDINKYSDIEYINFTISVYDGKTKNNEIKNQLINISWSGEYANNMLPKLIKGAKILVEGEAKLGLYTSLQTKEMVSTLTINYPSQVQILSDPKSVKTVDNKDDIIPF